MDKMRFDLIRIGTLFVCLLSTSLLVQAQRIPIQNRGSDSMAIAVSAWSEAYQKIDPEVGIAVSGGGSGTGIAALINGLVDIANASRPLTTKERMLAKKAQRDPIEHIVGYDAVAIYLHKDNPLKALSFTQLGGLFGRGGATKKWTDLGIEVPGCKDQKIILVSRQSSSGTYAYFRKIVIGEKYRNKYKPEILSTQSSKDLVELIGNTPCAIGYSSYAYHTPEVKAVCLIQQDTESCLEYAAESASKETTYPLIRPLYMYTDGEPNGKIKAYISWVLSKEGQCVLSGLNYTPVDKVNCQ
ncbi:MAG: phosphate ABC transporter substrate-binding protein [Candidatus Thiodiazotropha sp. (ex Lucinoma borealis)]|nr:phosphate ABC transporter substrate-binding protein [Candidatus Thiodiazotropha sp. (ex Lucinoma borealis)]